MDFSEFTTEQLETVIATQHATIARADGFRKEPGCTNHSYQNYTRAIEHAQQIIDAYQAELARRAIPAPQEEIAPMEPTFTATETTIQAADFAAALALIKPALIKRSRLPVLANVVLEGQDGVLALRLTDLVTTMQTTIPAAGQIAITVPYKALVALVGKTGAVTIRHTAPERVQVTTSTGTTDLPAITIDDAPVFPAWADWAAQTTLDGAVLAHAAKQVAFAASTDEYRPVLAGVLWRRTGAGSVFAAADGYRLGVLTTANGAGEGQDILPAPVFTALAKLTGPVTLYRNAQRSQVVAVAGNGVVMSRCIDGNFPTYEMIIPTERLTEARVDGAALTAAVKQLGTLAKTDACVLGMRAVGNRLILGATDGDGGQGRVELPLLAPVDGDHVQAVNYTYLLDAIGGHKGPVSVNLAPSPGAPLTVTKQADLLMVLMPMHLADRGRTGDTIKTVLADPTAAPVSEPVPEPVPMAQPADAPAPVKVRRTRNAAAPAVVVPEYPDHIHEGDWISDGITSGVVLARGSLRMGRKDVPGYRVAIGPEETSFMFVESVRKLETEESAPAVGDHTTIRPDGAADPVVQYPADFDRDYLLTLERRDGINRWPRENGIVQKPAWQWNGAAWVPGWTVWTGDDGVLFLAAAEIAPDRCMPLNEHETRAFAAYRAAQVAAVPEPAPVAYDMPVFLSSRDAPVPAPAPAPDTRWDAYPVGAAVRSRSSHLTGTIRRPGLRQGTAGVWVTGGVWLPLADAEVVPDAAPVAIIPMAPARVGPVGLAAPKPASKPQDKTPGPVASAPVDPVLDPVPVAAAVVAAAPVAPDPAPVDRPRRRGSYRSRPLDPRPLEERPIVITVCGVPRTAVGP